MSRHISLLLTSILLFLQPSVYSQVINVATQEDFGKLLDDNKLIVIKFYTTWCGACKVIEKPFEELSQESAAQGITFAQVDIDSLEGIKKQYGITYIPQFVFLKNGKKVKQKLFESLDTFSKDMMNDLQELKEADSDNETSEASAEPVPSKGDQSKSFLASIAKFIMIPITFIMNLFEKLFGMVKGIFG